MPLLDSRGRLFGRWNAVDATVVGSLLALAAVGIGAFVLFRTPIPTLATITPTEIAAGQPATLSLSGADFRPFLTLRIGPTTAPILVESPSTAEVTVSGVPAGTYDLVLFDNARELVRIADAITVAPPVSRAVMVQALGAFVELSEQDGARIRQGTILEEELSRLEVGQVLAVRPSEVSTQRFRASPYDTSIVTALMPGLTQVPAIVRFSCVVNGERCQLSETDLVRDARVTLAIPASDPAPSPNSSMNPASVVFRIDEVRPLGSPEEFDEAPPATPLEVQGLGTFVDLSEQNAARIRQGTTLEDILTRSEVGEVLAVRPPEVGTRRLRSSLYDGSVVTALAPGQAQVPAIVRLRCMAAGDRCSINGTELVEDALVTLAIPASDPSKDHTQVVFRLDELRLRSAAAVFDEHYDAVVRATFVASPEAAALMMEGDMDFGVLALDGDRGAGEPDETLRATILSIDTEGETVTAMMMAAAAFVPEPMVMFDATLQVPVVQDPSGWSYAGQLVKVGELLTFQGPAYSMEGRVRTVRLGGSIESN